jgi:hypothetical protein
MNPPIRRHAPLTLYLGLLGLLLCELLLLSDVMGRPGHVVVHTGGQLQQVLEQQPSSYYGQLARWVAVNMTALAWPAYILTLDGLLTWRDGASPIRRRPNHFALAVAGSVILWCLFDWINFYFMNRAWNYIGLPPGMGWHMRLYRYTGFLLAFGSILPGMMLSGQVFLSFGCFDWARSAAWRMPRWAVWLSLAAGAAMFIWPFIVRGPIANLTLWMSLAFLLDPINLWLGRPSMFRDWQAGWYGRTLAAFAGGLTCGFLWEFWNYWALTKWTYHLPFLGALEHYRYFEIPAIGLVGFIAFGIEFWIMWQTLRIPLDGLAEPLGDQKVLM